MPRQRNNGLKKVCGCPRRTWAKCRHPWHFSFQWKGERHRLSLDRHVGRPLTTKGAAEEAADDVRTAIRRGVFPPPPPQPTPQTADAVTLDAYADIFLERYSKARQKKSWTSDRSMLNQVTAFVLSDGAPFGAKAVGTITEDDVESFMQALKDKGRATSTQNKYLQTFLAMSKWGCRKGYFVRPWVGPLSDLKRGKHARRSRRLRPEEEARLLAVSAPGLYRLVVAAIETGCRQGELLALQWLDVDLNRKELMVRAENAKDDEHRYIPISRRLRAVLEMARHDPAGHVHGPTAYVFGNRVGRRVSSPKKAWETAVLKAHGHTPVWVKGAHRLAPASRAAYQAVDLKFHDLRHEAGSRWLEAGIPLSHVKALLGHANIATTDTYLNADRVHLHESMERAEARRSGKQVANSDVTAVGPEHAEEAHGEAKSLIN